MHYILILHIDLIFPPSVALSFEMQMSSPPPPLPHSFPGLLLLHVKMTQVFWGEREDRECTEASHVSSGACPFRRRVLSIRPASHVPAEKSPLRAAISACGRLASESFAITRLATPAPFPLFTPVG